ncbi:hypothetical protein IE077_002949 [Cardiosporidium cionae]|uniref:Uncharacterized protein n=1 Tax=Cardiosporidium cionae TaxID=476202 RepID=A0ABQ7JFA2_9APIC|nr:hypothetical protein IE077_002949 [Cardiosporidium cionae]|eukprot:KAF8822713.1 hypothetical protein IE077_002949 [Cardiosporidium cionae]
MHPYVISNRAGKKELHVHFDGLPIAGSPFDVVITSGTPCPASSRILGEGATECLASPSPNAIAKYYKATDCKLRVPQKMLQQNDVINQFVVLICDEFSNRVASGHHALCVNGRNGAKVKKVLDKKDGTYLISYAVYVPQEYFLRPPETPEMAEKADRATYAENSNSSNNTPKAYFDPTEKFNRDFHVEIDIFLNNMALFGCPLRVRVRNLAMLHNFYAKLSQMTKNEGDLAFEKHLSRAKFSQAVISLDKNAPAIEETELTTIETELRNITLEGCKQSSNFLQLRDETSSAVVVGKGRSIQQRWRQLLDIRVIRDTSRVDTREPERYRNKHWLTVTMV